MTHHPLFRRPNARLSAGAALALALLVSACGDSKSGSTSDTTAAGDTPTSAGATGSFKVNDASCPADAKQALAAGAPIKLGVTLPQTGIAAAFGALGPGMKTAFDKANAAGGIDGHKIELVVKDDGYEAARSVANTTQLIQQEKVMATVLDVGTPNVAGTRKLHEDACVPQLWVGTGFPAWGDPKAHQFTTIGIPAYTTEAKIWAEYIAKAKPGAKVAQLVLNNDFGKVLQKTFEAAAKDKGLTVVETKLHEATAPTIDNEVTAILAAQPDYVLGETTGAACPKLMGGLAKGGYKGQTIISLTCASVSSFFKPVDPAGNGVLVLGAQKDPSDPQYANDEGIKQYKADVGQYGGGANPNDGSVLTGYNVGTVVVQNLKDAAAAGGISRISLMNAAWNTKVKTPGSLGGTYEVNGSKDAYPVETLEFLKYDASKGSQVATGDKFDQEGKTGLFS
jgi:branched-chain amino acid transport system substrate-binding protein